ncbi:MAG: 2-dehydropantoate 2-reductase [bacterium]|nr:2-dehydropantoate 2-reductase [bacterium]
MKKLKIGIAGPGAVGGYYGACLARAGMDVKFLGRGSHLDAIKELGLSIKSYNGDFHVNPFASDDPAEIGPCDLILFCVKSFDSANMGRLIKPMVGSSTVILSLQNGVENEEILGGLYGSDKVLAGVAFIGSRIEKAGEIIHSASGNITFGESGGGVSARTEELEEIFTGAGIKARLSDDMRKVMWQKMVWNCGFNAITALTGCSAAEVLLLEETREIVRKTMEEVIVVAAALGIKLDAGLPEKTMAHTEKQGEIRTSMLVDMGKGQKMEIDGLNGAVCRKGGEKGVPTPVNGILYGMIKAINKRMENQ